MGHDDETIMERLRRETSELHSRAESRPLQRAIAKGEVERPAYIAYLGQLHAIHRTLEGAFDDVRGAHPAIDSVATPDRWRVPDLEFDLEFYGVDPEDLDSADATTRFVSLIESTKASDPVALLGALYVLEGSTNGGRFLAQVLRRRWNLDGAGVASLDPYGDRQPEHWAAFKRKMNGATFESEHRDAIVEMAKRTFEAIAEVSDEVSATG